MDESEQKSPLIQKVRNFFSNITARLKDRLDSRTESRDSRTDGPGSRAESRSSRTEGRGPRTDGRSSRTGDRAPCRRRSSSSRIILSGFAGTILVGTLLLMLPFASSEPGSASFSDALFTATSATCVTGLVVRDTATWWTPFGQAVILILIQIGGMGVVTMAIAISTIMGRNISFSERNTMQESISAPQVGGIVKLTRFILITTAAIELTGAALLAPVFIHDFGIPRGLWYALFHSVSAFCNAGFDLMGVRSQFSSMTSYQTNVWVNIVLMLLIIIGGIGFMTWNDVRTNGLRIKHYRLQSKVALFVTGILLIFPTIWFFCCEFQDLPVGQRFLTALFQSVTARTAGFNTADLSALSETGMMLMIILMVIGGCPGSTAGGMKTTTIAVLFFSASSLFRHQQSTHIFKRRIAEETVRSAATLLLMYVSLSLFGAMAISYLENVPMISALFEAGSAVATVGLSLGLTPTLGTASRFILVALMYIGRVGGLTIIFATVSERRGREERFPQEKITVG